MVNKTSGKLARAAKKAAAKRVAAKPALLAGGNPQIAKADGDAPVQAYIAAMPGWKRDVGRRLDALIVRTVHGVRKAVKWNSPFYGVEGQGWFLGIHCFTNYVKVAFFRGTSLRPVPPGESKQKEVRYLDIREDDPLDEAQLAAWVKQAGKLPGERM
ncbi:MAG: histidine kinase [Candidatus Lindowbacteria bacterium RIFCSPLOWO2_12_FULL_62_27]|nr:MAG: histidine kinase [Candidatus Lindowbacteria bacterium RIFCSPLOWO2_12_FULL_62_27]OGH62083.1 MAG: histidine kinase [Candidatus Lindowbacteria bacterium RIFCSPLOWO2_02_FULL_62_12]